MIASEVSPLGKRAAILTPYVGPPPIIHPESLPTRTHVGLPVVIAPRIYQILTLHEESRAMLAPFSFSYAPVVPMTTDTVILGIGHCPYIILIYLIFMGRRFQNFKFIIIDGEATAAIDQNLLTTKGKSW